MQQTPDEIILRVLECLYYVDDVFNIYGKKADLLATRNACKRLARLGEGLAFENITLIQGEKGYGRLLHMSHFPQLCARVQRLSCYFEDFDSESASTLQRFSQSGIIDTKDRKPEEIRDIYKEYQLGCQYQDLLEESNLDVASLAAAISRFYRLRSIKVSQILRDGQYNGFSLYRNELSAFAGSPVGSRFFEALTSALSVSKLRIESLTLGSCDPCSSFIIGDIQGLAPARSRLYQWAFGNLKRVRMLLPYIVDYEDHDGLNEFNFAGILGLIKAAALLEELRLEFDKNCIEAVPPNFLGVLSIAKLRVLVLRSARFSDPESLVEFLKKHATTLRSLSFYRVSLLTGSWETVFLGMREFLNLDDICLTKDFKLHGGKFLNDRLIEDFIQRKTDVNPFDILRSVCLEGYET